MKNPSNYRGQAVTKLVADMSKKKKSNEKCKISLSKKTFIAFGSQVAHTVNTGNQNLEAVLPTLQFKSRKINNRNVRNKTCVYLALVLQCLNLFHVLENYFLSTADTRPSRRKGTELKLG